MWTAVPQRQDREFRETEGDVPTKRRAMAEISANTVGVWMCCRRTGRIEIKGRLEPNERKAYDCRVEAAVLTVIRE